MHILTAIACMDIQYFICVQLVLEPRAVTKRAPVIPDSRCTCATGVLVACVPVHADVRGP
jgi:hypothetical protein